MYEEIVAMNEIIYVLDKTVELSEKPSTRFHSNTIYIEHKNKGDLKKAYELFYNSEVINHLFIHHSHFGKLKKDFLSLFQLIEGAGGLVRNNKRQTLMIFRNGKWDIPKGKIEKSEKKNIAAVREVEEECGIKNLKIIRELPYTLHSYKLKKKYVLKKTYWYLMKTNYSQKLTPQKEEGITKVKWVNKSDLNKVIKNSYSSIRKMIVKY